MIIHTETIAKKIMVLEVNVSTCIMTATQKMVISIMIIAITIMTTVIIIILNHVVSVDNNMRCNNGNDHRNNTGKLSILMMMAIARIIIVFRMTCNNPYRS